jgi:hypothetical protein
VRKVGKLGLHTSADAKKSKNKAGMLMIINNFCFWNRPKAGMYMKTGYLSAKAGMLLMVGEIAKIEEWT